MEREAPHHPWRCDFANRALNLILFFLLLTLAVPTSDGEEISRAGQHLMQNAHNCSEHLGAHACYHVAILLIVYR